MERKDMVMESKKPSADDVDVGLDGPKDHAASSSSANPSAAQKWEDGRVSSPPHDFFDMPRIQKELSSSEFLELLRMQGVERQFRSTPIMSADYNSHNIDGSQDYPSVAIDQCDITSSLDYGSRDYYRPSKLNSENSYVVSD